MGTVRSGKGYNWVRECTWRSVQCDFDIDVVQRGSTRGHWYMKVSTGNAVLIPTHSYNEHSTLNYLIDLEGA